MGLFGKSDSKPDGPGGAPVVPSPAPARAAPSPTPATGRPSLIAPKAVFKGELLGDDDVLVEGLVEGAVRISRELRVAPGGRVRATVSAQSVVVSGEITGDCTATARIEIQATGQLTGDIRAPRIVVAEGASFKGRSETSGRDPKRDKPGAS